MQIAFVPPYSMSWIKVLSKAFSVNFFSKYDHILVEDLGA